MHNYIDILPATQFGLQVYRVFLNGTLVHTFMSLTMAKTAAARLENKIKYGRG